jgi:hypothetical protein
MPEFDTYNAIERFARDNTDSAAYQAYRFLKHKASLMVQWRALQYAGYLEYQQAKELYTGTHERVEIPKTLEDMTEEQRKEMFMQACEATGTKLDPSLLATMNM